MQEVLPTVTGGKAGEYMRTGVGAAQMLQLGSTPGEDGSQPWMFRNEDPVGIPRWG